MLKIAIDIETSGLYPHSGSKIFCCAVNTGKAIEVHTDIKKLKPILEDRKITKVVHNAGFDLFWFKRLYNIDAKNIWDTMLMEQVIVGERLTYGPGTSENEIKELSTSLKHTLARYELAELKNKELGASFATRSLSTPLTKKEIDYAKNDVKYLLKLQKLQEAKIKSLKLAAVAQLENELVEALIAMRARGIGFDKDIWLGIAEENQKQFDALLKRLPKTVANWNSPKQVKNYFQSINIPLYSLTGAEEISKRYSHPVLTKFMKMRKLHKATTTYGAGWLTDKEKINTVDPDNRVRANFDQIVNTGRFSCSHPNLQQLPKKGEHRAAFVPIKNNVLVLGDFGGQEIGIAAAASGETRWIDAILNGHDIHSLTASTVFASEWAFGEEKGCTFPKKCNCDTHNELRHLAKIVNFTILYGGGEQEVAFNANMDIRDTRRLILKIKKSAPRLTRWLRNNMEATVKTNLSYSADPYRRRRIVRFRQYTIGKNNPIQACGANMIKLAMVELHKKNFPLVLQIHDELVIEVPKTSVKKITKDFKSVMENAADYCTGIPGLIKVDPIVCKNLNKLPI